MTVAFCTSYVYQRDASFHPRTKPSGRVLVFHACNPDDICLAACSRRIMLLETTEAEIGDVPVQKRCTKSACQRAFRAMVAP